MENFLKSGTLLDTVRLPDCSSPTGLHPLGFGGAVSAAGVLSLVCGYSSAKTSPLLLKINVRLGLKEKMHK